MCEGKKNCSCGCSSKKEKKRLNLKEGTWAPTTWDDNIALQAKNILRGMIDTSDSVDINKLIDKFQKKFYNKIGDDKLYDYLDQAALEFSRGFPSWKNNLEYAMQRIDQLAELYKSNKKTNEVKLREIHSKYDLSKNGKYKSKSKLLEKINLHLTSNGKIDMVKQAKIALDAMYALYVSIERKDIDHEVFLNMVDKTFENISELLAVLISQESEEIKEIKK